MASSPKAIETLSGAGSSSEQRERVIAGVNTARHDAYCRLLARGYRTSMEGVVMQSPNEPGYCRPDAYVIDDLG